MKLKVLQENLSKALSFSSRFANSRAQLPVLGNLLFSAKKTKLSISATNLEISVVTSVGAKTEKEGEITVPARVISDIVSNLPSGQIDLEVDKERLKIKAGNFQSVVSAMNSSDFPPVPQSADIKSSVLLPKEKFSEALSQVVFASSVDETRPILTGVLFVFEKGALTLVATDGFRLSQKKIAIKNSGKGQKIVLPKGIVSEISRLSTEDENLVFSVREKQVVFSVSDIVLSSRVLEGEFPDFEKIIPKSSTISIYVDKEELLRAVKLASVFARESANIIKLSVLKDSIEISAESSQSGSQKTQVDARVETQEKGFEIAFNYRFLEEFLHAASGEEVKIDFSSPSSPGVFKDTKDPDFLHLVMPVRIQG